MNSRVYSIRKDGKFWNSRAFVKTGKKWSRLCDAHLAFKYMSGNQRNGAELVTFELQEVSAAPISEVFANKKLSV